MTERQDREEQRKRLIAQAERQNFRWSRAPRYWDGWKLGVAIADHRMALGDAVREGDVVLVKPTPSNPSPELVTVYSPRLTAHVGVPADKIWIRED